MTDAPAPQPTKIVLPQWKTSVGEHPDGTEFEYTYVSGPFYVYDDQTFTSRLEEEDWDILEGGF